MNFIDIDSVQGKKGRVVSQNYFRLCVLQVQKKLHFRPNNILYRFQKLSAPLAILSPRLQAANCAASTKAAIEGPCPEIVA